MAANVVDFDPQTATILLVDDDAALRSLIRTPLQRCGYHVLEADSGEVATRIAEQAERIHLLLTELATPAISGPKLARNFRCRFPDFKVLYMSRHDLDEALSQPQIPEETFGFIQKPFAPDALAQWVHGILQSKAKTSEAQ